MFYIIALVVMIALIIYFHLDNLKFCRKLDKINHCLKNKKPIPGWEKL